MIESSKLNGRDTNTGMVGNKFSPNYAMLKGKLTKPDQVYEVATSILSSIEMMSLCLKENLTSKGS